MHGEELIHRLSLRVRRGESLVIRGEGTQRFDLLHVRDAAQGVVHFLKSHPRGWNEVYNVGSGKSVSLNALVERLDRVAREAGLRRVVDIERRPERTGDKPRWLEMDIARVRRTGWSPRVPLDEGLKAYFTEEGDRG